MTSCDSINNGQRGFSVETSKLEAVYFQLGFCVNLCQCLSAWPGVYLTPILSSKPVTGKRTPAVFLQPLPSWWEDGSCAEGSLPWREGVSCHRDGPGGYSLHLAHEGQTAARTLSAPKRARLAGPSKTGQEWALRALPANPLPLLLSLFKKTQ